MATKSSLYPTELLRPVRHQRAILIFIGLILTILHIRVELEVAKTYDHSLLLAIICLSSRILFFSRITIPRNLASLVVWMYFELSLVLWPAVILYLKGSIYESENGFILAYQLGEVSLAIHAVITLSFSRRPKPTRYFLESSTWKNLKKGPLNKWWVVFIASSYVVTGLAVLLGTATLGKAAEVQLPFKLNGLINYYHLYAVPFIYIVFLDIWFARNDKKNFRYWFLFFIFWLILESIARLSKGQFFFGFLPVVIWSLYIGTFKLKWLKWACAALPILLLLYPTISTYRSSNHAGIEISFMDAMSQHLNSFQNDSHTSAVIALRVYERIFGAGRQITKFEPYVAHPYIAGNLAEVISAGGSAKFHTRVIDNFPEHAVQSSGTTSISDAFLTGGIPLVATTVMLLSFVSVCFVDAGHWSVYPWTAGARAMGLMLLLELTMGGIWARLLDGYLTNIVWLSLFIWHAWLVLRTRRLTHHATSQELK